jgi:hypothetical protein
MKRVSETQETLTIHEATKLYALYAKQEKEAKEAGEKYKKEIIRYATMNRPTFLGKTLELPNGIRVELRETLKAKYNEEDITHDWLGRAIDNSLGNAVTVKIDPKVIDKIKLSDTQECILDEIEYETETGEIMAVCLTS